MKSYLPRVLSLCMLILLVLSNEYKFQHAKELQEGELQQIRDQHRITFVNFYSNNCGYCHDIAPLFDVLAFQFSNVQGAAVRRVDITKQPRLAEQQHIEVYPTLRLFIGDQFVDYQGKHQTQPMVEFASELLMARLLVIPKHDNARKPAVIITGISTQSNLQALPVLFKRYPIYYSAEGTQFSVLILDGRGAVEYEGEQKLVSIADWLEDQTAPVLVSLGTSKVPKKLRKALKNHLPILGFVNKSGEGSVEQPLKILEEHCKEVGDYVCGYVNKGEEDYDHLVGLIADPQESRNRLVWIDTFAKDIYLFEGDANQLTSDDIAQFVSGVVSGQIEVHSTYDARKQGGEFDVESIQEEGTEEAEEKKEEENDGEQQLGEEVGVEYVEELSEGMAEQL